MAFMIYGKVAKTAQAFIQKECHPSKLVTLQVRIQGKDQDDLINQMVHSLLNKFEEKIKEQISENEFARLETTPSSLARTSTVAIMDKVETFIKGRQSVTKICIDFLQTECDPTHLASLQITIKSTNENDLINQIVISLLKTLGETIQQKIPRDDIRGLKSTPEKLAQTSAAAISDKVKAFLASKPIQ